MKKKKLFDLWVFLSIVCFVYGIIVRAAGSGTSFFIVWLGLAVMFGFFALAVKKNLWSKLPKAIRKIFVVLVCAGLAFFVVIEGCVISGFGAKGQANLDYIIVLGAQVYERGPSVVLQYRLDEAIKYLEENPDTICIVSGGQGYNEPFAEAVGMADYLEQQGISPDRIILEAESKTTSENMANSKVYLPEGASVGIVTNNFHMFRALQTAKKQGIENVCGIAADSNPVYLPNNMFREFFGEIKFLIFG